MKRTLRQTYAHSDQGDLINAQPARDTSALILPVSVIKMIGNIRTDLGGLEELAASIREHGILQPLVVAKTSNGLELVAGHRRLEAAKRAGLLEVPVRVVGADEAQVAVIRLIENLQREDLSGTDEVLAVAKLAGIFPVQVQLAKALGKSKSYVSRCLKAAEFVKAGSFAGETLSKSALFELAYAERPDEVAASLVSGTKKEIREAKVSRASSGPRPGGRYVEDAITYRENKKTLAFFLKVNFDPERTAPATQEAIITRLTQVLERLRQCAAKEGR